jgi:hypothetical protein
MPVGLPEALARGDTERLPHDLEGDGRAPVLRPDGQALQLGEAAEEAQPQAGSRLAVDPTQQMQAAEVVAVEFLVERTVLVAHVDDGADGGGAQEIVHRAHDRYTLALCRAAVLGGFWSSA